MNRSEIRCRRFWARATGARLTKRTVVSAIDRTRAIARAREGIGATWFGDTNASGEERNHIRGKKERQPASVTNGPAGAPRWLSRYTSPAERTHDARAHRRSTNRWRLPSWPA